jgi:GDPmannose 4,6-dehydratase
MGRVFLTGVTGQDGSYLTERLLADGWEVHGLVRAVERADEQPVPDGVIPHVGDLADPEALSDLVTSVRPELVVNLGGITSVALSWQRPAMTGTVSGVAVAALVEACERLGGDTRLVQASSAEIFAGSGVDPQDESTPIAPTSPYGTAKAFAHRTVQLARSRGLRASNAILYNHESPRRPRSFASRKITDGVARIALGLADRLELGNLDAGRDWGWAPDHVDAVLRIAQAEGPGDDFVVATGEVHTVREFVHAAFAAADVDDPERYIVIDEKLLRPNDAPALRGDARHLRTELGWRPTTTFEEVVGAMVRHDLDVLSNEVSR